MPTLHELLIARPASGPLGAAITFIDSGIRLCCGVILWAGFLAIFLPTLANAVLRYSTNSSIVWSVEMTQLVFPWFIAAGATLAAQHGRHIRMTLLFALLPRRVVPAFDAFVQVLVMLACAGIIYVYLGFGQFEGGMKFMAGDVAFTSLGVAQSWSYMALLVGYILIALTSLTAVYRLFFDNDEEA